jgi:hypothetical protein
MSARIAWVPLAVMLAGCRGIIGVQDLSLVDGAAQDGAGAEPGTTEDDATTLDDATSPEDAGGGRPGEDAPPGDAPPPFDGGSPPPPLDAAVVPGSCSGQCNQCMGTCRQAAAPATNDALVQALIRSSCLCGAAGCTSASTCGTTSCDLGAPQPPSMACAMCMDTFIKSPSPECMQGLTECAKDSACSSLISCMNGCHN